MKRRITAALTAALTAAVVLTGCGGRDYPAPKTKPTISHDLATEVVQRGCNTSDFTMQCAYPRPIYDSAPGAFTANGIDFAWSCPDPDGWAFGASYLSPDPSKNWTPGCVRSWRARGKSLIFVWESTSTRAGDGYDAGHYDALRARDQAAALGNADRPIFFAIDTDYDGGQVVDYFNGVRSVLPYERVGAYGGIRPLEFLHAHAVVKYGWQAFAWSYGQWGFSLLRQVQNGDALDWDLALAQDYGQWPNPAPPPDPYRIFPKTRFALPYGQKASEYNTVKLYEGAGCKRQPRGWVRSVCKSSGWHLLLLRDRIVWVAHHRLTSHGWVALRHARYGESDLGPRLHRVQFDITH